MKKFVVDIYIEGSMQTVIPARSKKEAEKKAELWVSEKATLQDLEFHEATYIANPSKKSQPK